MERQTIKMTEDQYKILKAARDTKGWQQLLAYIKEQLSESEDDFWKLVFEMFPSLVGFNIYINWKEKEIIPTTKRKYPFGYDDEEVE